MYSTFAMLHVVADRVGTNPVMFDDFMGKKMGTGAKVAIAAAVAAVIGGVAYLATRPETGASSGGSPGGPTITITIT